MAARDRFPCLADRMSRAGGRPSGFDYLRVCLALAVVGWHSLVVSYGTDFQARFLAGPWRPAPALILPMFFALSGFLVAGSLRRNTIASFLALRALRIAPALAVEVCVSALLLGPLLTQLPVGEYFSDQRFLVYPLNIVGDIHYFLPGLFDNNPFPFYVNAQLWTIPFELECYVALALLALVGICRAPGPLLCATVTLNLVWAAEDLARGGWATAGSIVPGHVLPLCFLAGVVLYMFRDRVPFRFSWCAAAFALSLVGLSLPGGDYLVAFPVAYLTVAIGLLNPRKRWLVGWGDYSYGIYLYGFPIEQLVASRGAAFQHWYIVLALAVPLTVGLAALSWNLVERPILGLRRHAAVLDRLSDQVRQRRRRLAAAVVARFDRGLGAR
jgi:peptidoglycan/LPS O-acetylase OafA/YrhL